MVFKASSEPKPSALINTPMVGITGLTMGSPFSSTSFVVDDWSKLMFCSLACRNSDKRILRSAICFALGSFCTLNNSAPVLGIILNPKSRTGCDGSACLIALPLSSIMDLIRPKEHPTTTGSPMDNAPHLTNTSATIPLPFSICASNTTASD